MILTAGVLHVKTRAGVSAHPIYIAADDAAGIELECRRASMVTNGGRVEIITPDTVTDALPTPLPDDSPNWMRPYHRAGVRIYTDSDSIAEYWTG